MALPNDIQPGAPIFYAAENGLTVTEWTFASWVGSKKWYARTTTGHTPSNERCFVTRKEAVAVCVKKLKKQIRELEQQS